jgi:hypothetical protein
MALCPSTVASSGKPQDLYFALVEDIPPAQVLSQAGNTVSLSGGGGSVNVASTTSVASSAQKLTAVTYNTGLLETNVAGVLNVGLGSAIGSTRVEGGKVVISRGDANPRIEFVDDNTATVSNISYNGSHLVMPKVPKVINTTVTQSDELIPRSYLDNLINIALPAIAGYLPGTCSNLNKNIVKTNANLTQAVGNGNLYFLYPFIDTPISKIITYSGSSSPLTTATLAGLSLIEFPSLGATTGTCVATTGNVVGAPTNIWKVINTRYSVPLSNPYTLKAGFKYAISTVHNNPTTVSLLGFGMGTSIYSVGTAPNDVQTSDQYTGGIPTVGSTVTALGTGSGFVATFQLDP